MWEMQVSSADVAVIKLWHTELRERDYSNLIRKGISMAVILCLLYLDL